MRNHWLAAGVMVALLAPARTVRADAHDLYARYSGSIVAVTYYVETNFMHQVREVQGRDIGVVVTDSLILMNGAVMTSSSTGSQPHSFKVHFVGGSEQEARYVGRDEFANVAFLHLEKSAPAGVKPLRFDPRAQPRIGEEIYGLALLPENLDPMVRIATGRIVAAVEKPKPFFVTDLPVEEALGAPVFTAGGKPFGILSELGGAGPSFASGFGDAEGGGYGIILSAETLEPLVQNPPRRGEARRAWMGITPQALTPEMSEYWGVSASGGIVVDSVLPGSPADAAGLKEGDLLVEMNGRPIPVHLEDHVPIFIEQVGSSGVGTKVRLGILRQGKPLSFEVTLAPAPKSRLEAEEYRNPEFELTVRELVFSDYRELDLAPSFKGVLVSKVEEGGWAGVGGLQAGDVIQRVDEQTITTPAEMKKVLQDATQAEKRKLVFFVQRSGRTQFITVQPDWQGGS
jgi:S1-C subfamily serine protease